MSLRNPPCANVDDVTSFKHLVRTAVTVIAQGSELKMNINRSLRFKTWGFGKVNSSELITDY